MAKKQQPAWQFKLSMALSVFMLFLIFGYFTQSFLEIRKVKPVSVAIERITDYTGANKIGVAANASDASYIGNQIQLHSKN